MKTYKQLQERINMARAKMGDVIKDFQQSDAPQFKGKSQEKRRQMAIAAKMAAEEVELEEGRMKEIAMDINSMDDKEFKAKHKKSKQEMKDSLTSKEEVEQVDERWSENSKKTSKNLAAAALDVGNAATGGLLSKSKLAKKAMKWADSPDETTSKSRLKAYQARQARKANEEVEQIEESDLKPFIVVHAKHGKFETHAASTYEAAKNAAAHWKTKKGTSGMDVHRADITHSTQHVG